MRPAWRALPAFAPAALVPKCPACLCGVFMALGAAGVVQRLAARCGARVPIAVTVLGLGLAMLALCAGLLRALARAYSRAARPARTAGHSPARIE